VRKPTAFFLLLTLCVGLARAGTAPLKVVMLSGAWEYQSEQSLRAFKGYLEKHYRASCTLLQARKRDDLPGLEALDDCDVMLLFTRRLSLKGDQLERFKRYCLAGRPIAAVRTASHAIQTWLELDGEVLGGHYHGHYGGGAIQTVEIHPEAKGHPVLKGVEPLKSTYSLYKTGPLAKDAALLMTSSTPKATAPEPAAWTRGHKGGRVFYTSLGGPKDFQNPAFRQMLVNALFWTAKREVEGRPEP